jgi:hypothetical protein
MYVISNSDQLHKGQSNNRLTVTDVVVTMYFNKMDISPVWWLGVKNSPNVARVS